MFANMKILLWNPATPIVDRLDYCCELHYKTRAGLAIFVGPSTDQVQASGNE